MHPRLSALAALRLTDPDEKVAATHAAAALAATNTIATSPIRVEGDDTGVPGRPERPVRVAATAVEKRSPFTPDGRAALIHSICHIEFNAITSRWTLCGATTACPRPTTATGCAWPTKRRCTSRCCTRI